MDENEEKKKIRHTITAEETFTLAKDVFDIRTLIKNVYANRAVISRRLNIVTLCISTVFTALYAAFIIIIGLTNKLDISFEWVLYSLLGAYAVMAVVLVILAIISTNTKTKNLHKISTALKVFRLIVRLLSIAISIAAIYFAMIDGGYEEHLFAIDVVILVLSIFTLIVQCVPLLFGGTGKFVRWLLSPVKVKRRFSAVVLEWYELAVTGKTAEGMSKRVDKKYYEAIGALIDNKLLPELGKKYINTIKPATLLVLEEHISESDRPLFQGVIKSVFAYATELGYVTFDPCRDLDFSGSVEEEEKPKKTVKERLFGMGTKLGKKMLDKYISSNSSDEE